MYLICIIAVLGLYQMFCHIIDIILAGQDPLAPVQDSVPAISAVYSAYLTGHAIVLPVLYGTPIVITDFCLKHVFEVVTGINQSTEQ